MNYRYLFGPVPSRRLGRSLGIDLVPHKTCSFNCVYCECGKTTRLTIQRAEYVPTSEVLSELNQFLSADPQLDYVTFSGAGEPTLHIGLGKIVTFIKTNFPHYKLAILTNSSLFYQKVLRAEIIDIDLILPSLDAADEDIFHKINRPHPEIGLNQIISGLIELRKIHQGQMWLEIFIVPRLNDSPDHIDKLKQAIHQIKPDIVQLNTLDRPGTTSWVTRALQDQLEDIAKQLDWHTEVIAQFPDRKASKAYQRDIESAILEIIKRRPCTLEDLSRMLGLHVNEVNKYLDVLIKADKIHARQMERGLFYWAKASKIAN
ncbi:MAG: radical SAM protein [bacterium]|nr:MAG: radical SAM protein [bacterium]